MHATSPIGNHKTSQINIDNTGIYSGFIFNVIRLCPLYRFNEWYFLVVGSLYEPANISFIIRTNDIISISIQYLYRNEEEIRQQGPRVFSEIYKGCTTYNEQRSPNKGKHLVYGPRSGFPVSNAITPTGPPTPFTESASPIHHLMMR